MRYGGRRLATVVVAGVLGFSASGCGERGAGGADGGGKEPVRAAAAYAGLEALPAKLDANGTTIVVGDPDAPLVVHLYEDPRCPVCEEFERTGGGPVLQTRTERREVRTEYTLASFLDGRVGGEGSKKAVNALRAALDAGKFAKYHAVLYAHQPEESVDGYTDDFLLELAGQVEGLRGPEFDAAVKTMKYRDFVNASQKVYEKAGGDDPRGPGTPTAEINGVRVPEEHNGVLFDGKLLGELLTEIMRNPKGWASFH
ncbi:DsbA family protein [Streptomyces sp. NBC_00435]|uniref:thioredoxin domain-containing protein n=1 Tax=Streptomyces sp. NBC_00435 TaxID=2903649 RepID=UPI002E1A3E3B